MILNQTKKLFLLSLLLLLFAGAATFAVDLAAPLTWDEAVLTGTLDNGLTYYIQENRKPEKRAELRLFVKAGSLMEEDNEQGIAHYNEHMAFNGTEHFPPGDLVKFLELIGMEFGGDNNAYTSFDRTVYILTVPLENDNLDTALTVMSDYANGMLFLTEEVDKERGVILEELRLGRGLEMRLLEKGIAIALKGSKYADRLPIGKKENIEKFNSDSFKKFYGKWYRTDRLALAVVGDFDRAEMEKKVKEKFGSLPAPPDSEPVPAFPFQPHEEIYTGILTDPELPVGGVTILSIREPGARATVGDFYRRTLENVAVSIYNSRMEEIASTTKNPPFKYAGVYKDRLVVDFDLLVIYGMSNMKKELNTLEVVLREAERIKRHGVLPAEVAEKIAGLDEYYRRQVEEKDKQESAWLIYDLSDAYHYGYVPTGIEYEQALFNEIREAITVEKVQDAFNEMFKRVNMSAILALPEFMKKTYKEEQILETVEKVMVEDIAPYAREEKKKEFDYSKLTPGKIAKRETDEAFGVTRVVFENGLRVLLKPTDFKEDEILFESFSPGGELHEDYSNRGVARIASMSWLDGGTKDFTKTDIDRMQSGKTINIWAKGGYGLSLGGSTVKKDFEEALQWLYDYITAPAYREEVVERMKKMEIDYLRELPLNQDQFFYVTSAGTLCPDSPITAVPTEDDINRITPDQLKELQMTTYVPSNIQFTFVGNFEVDAAVELIARYLGSLPVKEAKPISEAARTCTFPEGLTRRTIYRGIENRNLTVVAYPAPGYDSPDLPALKVLTKVADIRLNDTLREEMGGTYFSYFVHRKSDVMEGYNYFSSGFGTDPDKVEGMLAKLYEVVGGLKTDAPTDEEMTRAREVFTKDFEENLKRNEYWQNILDGADIVGRPLNFFHKLHEDSLKVTSEQV
ncbi:MAG: insulinase family protein, partial [bacterium]